MGKNGSIRIVNGRHVTGNLTHSESNLSVIKTDLSEVVCFVDFSSSLLFKFEGLVKYARLTYGLSHVEFKCMNVIAMGKKDFISFSAFLFASSLHKDRTVFVLNRIVALGFVLVDFHVYKGRRCKRVGLTAEGKRVYEDIGRYWDDVLRYRTM